MSYWTQTIFGRRPAAVGPGALAGLATLLLAWQDRVQQRHRLAELDDAMLKDIGLSRADAVRETTKPFWIL